MRDPILKTKNLSVAYKKNRVIEGVNLDFMQGKIYSIIGPNGCGKTTLMRAISRNIRPTAGMVQLKGNNIFKMNTKQVAQHMAMLAQNNATMSDVTVKALVQYGRYAHRNWWQGNSVQDSQMVEWAIAKTGMSSYANRKINTLSGGERQRAWIAMSVAQSPEILLLDEPTTYLDIAHQLEIMELVRKLNKEESITIIMVLHDINHAARYSDELVVLYDHQVHAQGDPWTLLESGIIQKVFRVKAEILEDKQNGAPIFYAKKVVDSQ